MPSRCCIHYASKSGRPSSGHRTGKGQSSSQFPRRVVLKNTLTIGQLHSSPMLAISVQSLSHVQLSVAPCTAAHQASLSLTNSQSLLKLMSVKSVMPSNHLILSSPLILLPSVFPSIRVFSSESVLHITWPKYWSFSFSISPSNEYSGLISFRIDWLDLLAVQGTLKSLLQHHSSKASTIWWRRGWQRTRWLDGITYSMDMSLSKLQDRRR